MTSWQFLGCFVLALALTIGYISLMAWIDRKTR